MTERKPASGVECGVGSESGSGLTREQAERFLNSYRYRLRTLMNSNYLTRACELEVEMLNADIARIEALLAYEPPHRASGRRSE